MYCIKNEVNPDIDSEYQYHSLVDGGGDNSSVNVSVLWFWLGSLLLNNVSVSVMYFRCHVFLSQSCVEDL